MKKKPYLAAPEAADELGVSLTTLYAYVSRGLIRSEAVGGSKRNHRYHADDVQRLKERQEQRRDPGKVVARALHWGTPVLESSLTFIADGKLYYRGHDAIALATQQTVERVAALIWTGRFDEEKLFSERPEKQLAKAKAIRANLGTLSVVEAFQAVLAATEDVAAYNLRPAAVAQTGARILWLLTSLAANFAIGKSIAHTLARNWAAGDRQAAALLNAALSLCADHELNVSAFTARCVASAGATPYQVVIAGLAALQGIKHGRHSEQVEAFLDEAGSHKRIHSAMVSRLKRGEPVPGFGHPLYPDGDPRAGALLQLIAQAYPKSSAVIMANAAAREASELVGEYPNIDFALVILVRALNLPPGSALTLFALGRTIGWIGHALEQYRTGELIRPRARYVGEAPSKIPNLNVLE